jgi:mono/diheme cytochrome c family protein
LRLGHLLVAGALGLPVECAAAENPVEQGRYLFHAALCGVCHTAEGGEFLAGGRPLPTPFGTFYTPNITPDPEHGIGRWSDEDFARALSQGVSPAGKHYYPAFPYTAYTRLTRADTLAIKAYLNTVEPSPQPNRPHELAWYADFRWPLAVWKWLYFQPGEFVPDASHDTQWNRGAYLAQAASHCAECHSPRNLLGALGRDRLYAGAIDGPEGKSTPNITPDKTGIGGWTPSMLSFYLEIGMTPDGDFAGSLMADVIDQGTGKLTPEDRAAIATYLLSLPPLPAEHKVDERETPKDSAVGAAGTEARP